MTLQDDEDGFGGDSTTRKLLFHKATKKTKKTVKATKKTKKDVKVIKPKRPIVVGKKAIKAKITSILH